LACVALDGRVKPGHGVYGNDLQPLRQAIEYGCAVTYWHQSDSGRWEKQG